MVADTVRFAQRDPASLWAARQIGIKDLDSVRDVWQIDDYLKNNETPWDRDIRLANEQRDAIAGRLESLTADFYDKMAEQAEANRQAIASVTRDLTTGYENRISGLVEAQNKERDRFNTQFNALQGQYDKQSEAFNALNLQYTELNEANAEQQRLASNASRASVPDPVQSAELPTSGDQRDAQMRRGKDNNLSNLTLLTGLNSGSSSSSGLQLA